MKPEEYMALLTVDEPLHEDLQPYLSESSGLGWPVLQHPLVYMVPYHAPALANRMYAEKQEAVEQAVADCKWSTYLYLHERPYRLDALSRVVDLVDDRTYWALLGDIWTDTENQWQNLDTWHRMLTADRPGREAMMAEEEQAALAAQPDRLTIYRGCQAEINEDGLSWTLDRDKAAWFARRFDRDGAQALVIVAQVDKAHVAAHFLGRGEREIVIDAVEEIKIVRYEEV